MLLGYFAGVVVVLGAAFALGPALFALHLTFSEQKAERLVLASRDEPRETVLGVCRYCGEGVNSDEMGEVHYQIGMESVA
jgi:hypothetical protein